MSLFSLPVGKIIESIGGVADALHTSEEEILKAQIANRQIDYKFAELAEQNAIAQTEVNKESAKHSSVFVAGARPAIIWICGAALAYHFIFQPFLVFLSVVIGLDISALPPFDMGELMTVLLGLLGLAGARTYEKNKRGGA